MKRLGKQQGTEGPEPRLIPDEVSAAARAGVTKVVAAAVDEELAAETVEDYGLYTVSEALARLADLHRRRMLMAYGLGLSADNARRHAEDAWRAALPEITNKHNGLIYIAAIAWGMRNRVIEATEAKIMVYLVQTQLTVLKAESTSILRDGTLPVDDRQLMLPGTEGRNEP